MKFRIECYDGTEHPAVVPYAVAQVATMREARRVAAKMLGHDTLRGAASWDRFQGGTVWQFGPRTEDNGEDFAVIIDEPMPED